MWKDCNTLLKYKEFYLKELPFYSFEVDFGYVVYKGKESDLAELLSKFDRFDSNFVPTSVGELYAIDKDKEEERFIQAVDFIKDNFVKVADFIGNHTDNRNELDIIYTFHEIEKETLDKIKEAISEDYSNDVYFVLRVDGLENFKKIVKKNSDGVWESHTNRHFKDSDFDDIYMLVIFTEEYISDYPGV